jgi:Tol biopolymer transport system component
MPDTPFTIYCLTAPAPVGLPGNASYRGHDRRGRPVVLHLLQASRAAVQSLERQAVKAAQLDPASVCRLLQTTTWFDHTLVVEEEGAGELLRDRLARGPLAVRDLVEVGVQICGAVEAAHQIGLNHLSLASDCFYVAADNQVQVAGFGYAGALRGEPACRAPETFRGMADRRSDVYGIGAILWEMATGEVAPADPTPATQLRPDLPLIVDGIIRTALEPAPGKRFQTAAGLGYALRHFLEGTATPERLSRAAVDGAAVRGRRKRRTNRDPKWASRMTWVRRVAGVALAGTLATTLYFWSSGRESYRKMSVTVLTSSDDVVSAAVSPDAAHVALVRQEREGQSLWIQATSGKEPTRLAPAGGERITSVAFSPSGDRIYYVTGEPGTLRSVEAKGGGVESLARRVTTPRVAPDGRRMAFLRMVGTEHTVVISKLDGSEESVALSRAAPARLWVAAWEPGGRMFGLGVFVPGEGSQLLTAQVDGSFSQPLGWQQWPGPMDLEWLPSGGAMIVVAPERGGDGRIWKVRYPEGTTSALVGGGDYRGVSLSRNGKTLVSISTVRRASVWVAPAEDPGAARAITRGEGPEGVYGLDWVGADRIVYTSEDERGRGLWLIDAEGKNSGAILRDGDRAITPHASPDGVTIAFIWIQDKVRHLWTITAGGKDLRDVTRTGIQAGPRFGPDAGAVYYHASTDPAVGVVDAGETGIWKVPVVGGRPERIVRELADHHAISPDGARIAYRSGGQVVVAALPTGEVQTRIEAPEPGEIGWTPDGAAIVWARSEGDAANLWAHPIKGGTAVAVTRFRTPGRIHSFAWSRDGRAIAVSRGRETRNAVMLRDKGW